MAGRTCGGVRPRLEQKVATAQTFSLRPLKSAWLGGIEKNSGQGRFATQAIRLRRAPREAVGRPWPNDIWEDACDSFGRSRFVLIGATIGAALGAAPAAPSYQAVETSIARIRADWAKPGVTRRPERTGLERVLRRAPARPEGVRRGDVGQRPAGGAWAGSIRNRWRWGRSPGRRRRRSTRRCGPGWSRGSGWPGPSAGSRTGSGGCPPRPTPTVMGNRDRWVQFVNNGLGAGASAV